MQLVSDPLVTKFIQGKITLSVFRHGSRLGLATLSLLGRKDGWGAILGHLRGP